MLNNLEEATHDVIKEAQTNGTINPICFSLSNLAIQLFAMEYNVKNLEFNIPITTNLNMDIGIDFLGGVPGISSVSINPIDETIKISFKMSIVFRDRQGQALASVGQILIDTINKAKMIEGNQLQLVVERASITNRPAIHVDYFPSGRISGKDIIIREFHTEAKFKEFYSGVLNELEQPSNNNSKYGFAINAVISSIDLPQLWNNLVGFVVEVNAKHKVIYYREISSNNQRCGAIFFVLSVRSLGLPPPCIYEELATRTPTPDRLGLAEISSLTVGISEDALNEIIKPLIENALYIHKKYSRGGSVRGELEYFAEARVNKIKILSDRIKTLFNLARTGGTISAKIVAGRWGNREYVLERASAGI
ncbi:MAG TPA: hypothetical protein VN704_00505, partial [Verrucomicrobiae bacterium]|nr:hypothetical protein [Verrucomicrobiae bacterium]